jgi:hypothetical protein
MSGDTDKPIAAGVLRLTLRAFLRQLRSMEVLGDFGWFDRRMQKLAFYRFFMTSLARTYIKGRRW